MTFTRAAIPALCAALFASCAPKRSAVLLDTTATPPELVRRLVNENSRRLATLVGSGVVTFDSPELAGTAAFSSTLKKPDSLLVTFEGPFGIDVGTFFLCKDSYVVYNSLENSVVTGDPHRTAVRSILPFELTNEQILNAFAGIFPLPDADAAPTAYRVEEEKFVLSYRCGEYACTFWVDPRYLLVTQYEMRTPDGEVLMQGRASSLTEQNGVRTARRIRIVFPAQQRQLSIAYSSLRINTPETDFRFSIPANARRIVR